MRHRAPRPVLARLRSFASTPRNAAVALALVTAGAATGAVLTVADAPESTRTGAPTAAPPAEAPETDPPAPTPHSASPDADADRADHRRDRSRAEVEKSRAAERATRGDERPTDSATREAAREVEAAPTPEPTTSPEDPQPAPNTTAATRNTNSNHWVIGLASDVEEATFECSLDGGAYASCGSTVSYRDLSEGTHTFSARATGPGGTTDPTPARLTAEISGTGRD